MPAAVNFEPLLLLGLLTPPPSSSSSCPRVSSLLARRVAVARVLRRVMLLGEPESGLAGAVHRCLRGFVVELLFLL